MGKALNVGDYVWTIHDEEETYSIQRSQIDGFVDRQRNVLAVVSVEKDGLNGVISSLMTWHLQASAQACVERLTKIRETVRQDLNFGDGNASKEVWLVSPNYWLPGSKLYRCEAGGSLGGWESTYPMTYRGLQRPSIPWAFLFRSEFTAGRFAMLGKQLRRSFETEVQAIPNDWVTEWDHLPRRIVPEWTWQPELAWWPEYLGKTPPASPTIH